MIGDILIPLIWAGGLFGLASLITRSDKIRPELFFPAAGVLGLAIYGLGLIGSLYPGIFIGLTLVFALSALWYIYKTNAIQRLISVIKDHPLITVIIAFVLFWFSLAALSYPVNIDALYFHLGLPKLYAHAGKIFFTEGNLFSAAPRTLEMIITAFYSMGLERAGQFFAMLIAAIFIWAVWQRAGLFGGDGKISALLILTIPIFTTQAICSKNDFLLWGLCFFAICKFWEFVQNGKMSDLIWAGVGAGMAAGTKAIGLALYAPLALMLLYNILFGKYRLRHFVCFSAAFLLLCSPWYIYSWIITGNPVYPFFNSIFHSPYFPAVYESFNNELAIKTVEKGLVSYLISPFKLVFYPDLYDGRLGFAIILFPALLLFVRKIPSGIKTLGWISLMFYPIWFFGFTYARFLLPVLPALAIASSFLVLAVGRENRLLKITVWVSLIIALILPLPALVRDMSPRIKSVIRGESKHDFLSRLEVLDSYQTQSAIAFKPFAYIDAWEYLNQSSPPDSRIGILTSFGTRADGYYLERNFIYLNPSEQLEYNFTKLRESGEIAESLKALKINYIVIDSMVAKEFSQSSGWSHYPHFELFSDGVKALLNFCNTRCQPVFSDSRYKIYKI